MAAQHLWRCGAARAGSAAGRGPCWASWPAAAPPRAQIHHRTEGARLKCGRVLLQALLLGPGATAERVTLVLDFCSEENNQERKIEVGPVHMVPAAAFSWSSRSWRRDEKHGMGYLAIRFRELRITYELLFSFIFPQYTHNEMCDRLPPGLWQTIGEKSQQSQFWLRCLGGLNI